MLVRRDAVLRGVLEGGWAERLKTEEGTARACVPLKAWPSSAACMHRNLA